MRLDDYAIRPRVRNSWEAMDLGTLLFQRDLFAILRSGLLLWFPVGAFSLALMFWTHLFWAVLFLWFMRPLLGRVALYIISRRVFSVNPSAQDVAQALPVFAFKALFATLIGRRFGNQTRSFTDPVVMLEELSGRAYKTRVRDLLGGGMRGAMWRLGRGIALVEVCLVLAMLAICTMFAPDLFQDFESAADLGMSSSLQIALLFSIWVVTAVVEPLWVATGFALYLNRRSELEGWDVELIFRSLGQRVREQGQFLASGFPILLPLILSVGLGSGGVLSSSGQGGIAVPLAVTSQEEGSPRDGTPADGAASGEALDRVYERGELSTTVEQWVPKDSDSSALDGFSDLEGIFEVLVWLIVGAFVCFLAYRLYCWAIGREPRVVRETQPVRAPVEELVGLDVRAESLPEDLIGEARAHWERGDPKAALSLLYRGSLAHLATNFGVPFESGDTEGRCVDKTKASIGDATHAYFARLTTSWQAMAYGLTAPGPKDFDGLVENFEEYFGGQA